MNSSLPALILLGVIAVAGLRWRLLGWFAWVGGMALLAVVESTGLGAIFLWIFGYPIAMLAASRRGRISRRDDVHGHLSETPEVPIDPIMADRMRQLSHRLGWPWNS